MKKQTVFAVRRSKVSRSWEVKLRCGHKVRVGQKHKPLPGGQFYCPQCP